MVKSANFVLPKGLVGRFAVVKLWPEVQAAEDECIARLKITAKALGLECVEIYSDGRFLAEPTKTITPKDVDFVLHLHYDTPKLYDAFSFVALWNPTSFYHEWNYSRCTRNLLTHDDFLSCSSPAADAHVERLIRKVSTHLPPQFNLYHSVVDVIHSPSLGDGKLFYAGINWEAMGGRKKSRHGKLLDLLDKTDKLRIYGPKIFLNVQVWKGFQSYVKEIPFDGCSMMDEISKAGVALVLSSEAHKECELMSNRLFESIAAGALVICDENPFAKKFFGDTLLYIDTRLPVEKVCEEILKHLAWAEKNKTQSLAMIEKSQEIFRQKFTLKKNLSDLYLGFLDRKKALLERQDAKEELRVALNLMMPTYSKELLKNHIQNALSQEYKKFFPVLVIDKDISKKNSETIKKALEKLPINIALKEVEFFQNDSPEPIKPRQKLGKVIAELLEHSSTCDAVVFVAPNEKILSNHLQVLAYSLMRNPETGCVASAEILKRGEKPVNTVFERINFRGCDLNYPNGYARFIFRVSVLPQDLDLALPFLDRKTLAALVGESEIAQEIPSTVIVDVENEFTSKLVEEAYENMIIHDMFPKAFANTYTGHEIILPSSLLLPPELDFVGAQSVNGKMAAIKLVFQVFFRWIYVQTKVLLKEGVRRRLGALKRKAERASFLLKKGG